MEEVLLVCLLFSILYDQSEGNGIVKSVMGDNEDWGPEGEVKFSHHLECYYEHTFESSSWTYTYDLRCIEYEDKNEKVVRIDYDNNVFDRYVVTSCELEDVVNSVFPPKQLKTYPDGETDQLGRNIFAHMKYKTEKGECFDRKYQFVNRVATAAKRFTPEKIKCEGDPDWFKHGEPARFTNCRVNQLKLSHIVKDWSHGELEWTPWEGEGAKKEKLLECTYDQFSKLYKLACVKGEQPDEYYVFVIYTWYDDTFDRFVVSSCKEDDIVYGIFPIKDTYKYPKGDNFVQTLWFSHQDGRCFKREYDEERDLTKPPEATQLPCPSNKNDWVNPEFGFAGMWCQCQGPMSIAGKTTSP